MLKKQFSKEKVTASKILLFHHVFCLYLRERDKEIFVYFYPFTIFCCVLYAKSFRSDPAARTIALDKAHRKSNQRRSAKDKKNKKIKRRRRSFRQRSFVLSWPFYVYELVCSKPGPIKLATNYNRIEKSIYFYLVAKVIIKQQKLDCNNN